MNTHDELLDFTNAAEKFFGKLGMGLYNLWIRF